ncbi:MAG: tagatose 1,6-diphosphate aldolase [Dehalococcoidia bacterium]|nr:MAG: tagatose 1,6-diphosphate aldolase [Dehalococcoidia bacterium]
MNALSIGKIRGLQQIAGADGIFTMCAMDHRGSLESVLCAPERTDNCPREMTDFKLDLCEALAPYASAVLLDPIYGATQCISRSLIPKTCGLLVSLEATGYTGDSQYRKTRLLENWSVAKLKRMGASAAKMLVYYRPDLRELAQKQLQLVGEVARECQRFDIPFLVEPLSYPIGEEVNSAKQFAEIKSSVVIQTARDMTALPIDVLKAEFPADLAHQRDDRELRRSCEELNNASQKPWVILSAGTSFEPFIKEVELACRAGASGFLAGRAVWQEAIAMTDGSVRRKFLATIAADRLKKLAEVAHQYAAPWYKKLSLTSQNLAEITSDWHTSYEDNT